MYKYFYIQSFVRIYLMISLSSASVLIPGFPSRGRQKPTQASNENVGHRWEVLQEHCDGHIQPKGVHLGQAPGQTHIHLPFKDPKI